MKKALAIVLALLMAFTAIQVIAFAEGEEPAKKYIKGIFAGTGSTEAKAKADLTEELDKTGDEYKIIDFNVNYGDTDDLLYLGCTYTANEDEAVTGIMIETTRFLGSKTILKVNGIEYTKQINDLNKGAGGNVVALFTTTSRTTGKLITDIGFKVLEDSDVIVGAADWETVKLYPELTTAANVNEGTDLGYTINMTYNAVEDQTATELSSTYIKEIYMSTGAPAAARSSLIETLQNKAGSDKNYGLVDYNLNSGASSDTEVYLGYILTKDPKEAIKGLVMNVTDNDSQNDRFTYDPDGRKYELVGENFNTGTKGKTINLYATYEETGKVLNLLGAEDTSMHIATFSKSFGDWSEICETGTDDKVDVNDGAGALSHFIYMWQRLSDYTAENVAPKYVKEIYVRAGDSFTAAYNALEEELKKLGEYDMITFNLNEGTKEGKAVVLGWTLTEKKDEAIADVMLHHSSKDVLPDTFEKDGLTYTKYDVNFNEGIEDGGFLYLYSTRSKDAKSLVSDMGVEMYSHFWSKSVKYFVQTDEWNTIRTYAGDSKYDLNEDVGGDYIYLWYLKASVKEDNTDTNTSDSDNKTSDTDNKNSDKDNSDKDNSDKDNSDKDNSDKDNTDSEKYVYGDVNRDTKVNMEDVTKIQKVLAKLDSLTKLAEKCADVTGDNKVTMEDVTTIQRYIAKLINVFPVEAKKK